jgi:hypothetical protein
MASLKVSRSKICSHLLVSQQHREPKANQRPAENGGEHGRHLQTRHVTASCMPSLSCSPSHKQSTARAAAASLPTTAARRTPTRSAVKQVMRVGSAVAAETQQLRGT